MYRKLIAGTACLILLASPVAAATNATATASQSKVAGHSSTSMQKKTVRHTHRKKIAMNTSTRGDKEVNALNSLEAAGYRQFANLHAMGAGFVGTAQKAGKIYDVTVMPSGSIKAARA
jgi:hypothetical protein